MVRHYTTRMRDLCEKTLKIPERVKTSAITYFKRFFLYNSIMVHDVLAIMATCVYLACKAEETRIPAKDICAKIKGVTVDSIIEKELVVLTALKFHLTIYTPYRPLHGFILDFQEKQKISSINTDFYEKARTFVTYSILNDLSFIYPSGQIALAALSKVSKLFELGQQFQSFLTKMLANNSNATQVKENLSQIEPQLEPITIDPKVITELDKKLRSYKKPVLAPAPPIAPAKYPPVQIVTPPANSK
eukprot:TRINITY_DN6442_c0_g1_i1.p1 TRINITY_DN6442_c0_g1~~TRINITY_DN6442_c0_g1_i1.p1  ORF type:complete len:246 (-),score=33.21 TRINITY_DN6442_c0_g1_i1:22-759(-)